jgi:subtilisin family serine protease
MNKITVTRNLITLLLLFTSICFSFAQKSSIMTLRLSEKIAQQQTVAAKSLSSSKSQDYIEVLFIPEGDNSDNIDISFFTSRNIEYIKFPSFILAKIPLRIISDIETIHGVKYADLEAVAKPMETVSEGRELIGATKFVLEGVDGRGVKIAVIDTGFKNYNKLQNRGELPLKLKTRDFTIGSQPEINPAEETDLHGSACAEIIYDIAPRVEMYLLKVRTPTQFANAYVYCIAEGINIVSCSLGFPDGYGFMDGTNQLVNGSVDSGTTHNILSVVCAGNEGDKSWFGKFQDSGGSEHFMKFQSGKDYLDVNVPIGSKIELRWNDFTNMNTAYNVCLYDQSEVFVAASSYVVNGSPPVAHVTNTSTQSALRLRIKKTFDPNLNPMEMRLILMSNTVPVRSAPFVVDPADRNPESSLCMPGDTRTALTVGAVPSSNYDSSGEIAAYSSRGPIRATNTLPALIKPDIVAPANVTTVSCGSRGFVGTSAATPHVAGAAALLLSLDNTLSTSIARFKEHVVSYARQTQSSPDNTYGQGKLVLNSNIIPYTGVGDFVCYPNPVSISGKGYIKITNLPFNTSMIDIAVYTVTGEFVKSFSADDSEEDTSINKRMIKWNLKNQSEKSIAPGVYFVTIKTLLGKKQVKKIAIQK